MDDQPPRLLGNASRDLPQLPTSASEPTQASTGEVPRVRMDGQRLDIVNLVAAGYPNTRVAAELGISETTVRRRRDEPGFLEALDKALQVVEAASYRRLKALTEAAVDRIVYLMEHGDKDNRTQLDAAALVLAHVFGQPARRSVVTGAHGGPIEHRTVTVHYNAEAPRGQRYQVIEGEARDVTAQRLTEATANRADEIS